jgi:hypothetical protein
MLKRNVLTNYIIAYCGKCTFSKCLATRTQVTPHHIVILCGHEPMKRR